MAGIKAAETGIIANESYRRRIRLIEIVKRKLKERGLKEEDLSLMELEALFAEAKDEMGGGQRGHPAAARPWGGSG